MLILLKLHIMPIEIVGGGGVQQPVGGKQGGKPLQDVAVKTDTSKAEAKNPAEARPEVERLLGGPMPPDALETTVKVLELHREITAGDKPKVDELVQTLEKLDDPTFEAVILASSVCGAWFGGILAEEDRLKRLSEDRQRRLAAKEEQVRKMTTVTPSEGATGGLVDTKA